MVKLTFLLDNGSRLQFAELLKLSYFNLGDSREGELGSLERYESNKIIFEEMYRNPNLIVKMEIDVMKEKVNRRNRLLRINEGFLQKVIVYYIENKKHFQENGEQQDLFFTNKNYSALDGEDLAEDGPTLATILFQDGD